MAHLDPPEWGIKDVDLLELLIDSSLGSVFLKMKMAKKQSVQDEGGWTLLHAPAVDGAP